MKQLILAVTGASGAAYAQRVARLLAEREVHLHVVCSDAGRVVMADELPPGADPLDVLLGRKAENATLYNVRDVGARIASGSFRTAGMVICPCSAHTLGAVAGGLADNLVTRAAMVTLKESRRLVLVPREMPLSAIEIENMLKASRAGAVICPACPGFYMKPQRVDDLLDFVAGRVLDLLDVPHDLNTRWDPRKARGPRGGAAREAQE